MAMQRPVMPAGCPPVNHVTYRSYLLASLLQPRPSGQPFNQKLKELYLLASRGISHLIDRLSSRASVEVFSPARRAQLPQFLTTLSSQSLLEWSTVQIRKCSSFCIYSFYIFLPACYPEVLRHLHPAFERSSGTSE